MREMISDKVRAVPPSVIRAMFDKAAAMEGVISLGIGDPDFDTPAEVCEKALADTLAGYTHYSPSQGYPDLRAELVAYLARVFGYEVSPANLVITGGGMGALTATCTALLNPGEEIILCEPYFGSYRAHIEFGGGRMVLSPTRFEEGFLPSVERIAAAVTPRTKAILLNSPNNPTGAITPPGVLDGLAALAREKDLVVISDEVYDRLVFTGRHDSAGMASARWGSAPFQAFAMTAGVGGSSPPRHGHGHPQGGGLLHLLPPRVSQRAALAALRMGDAFVNQMHEEFQARCQLAYRRLQAMPGVAVNPVQGSFYIFPRLDALAGGPAQAFCEALLERERVVVIPGESFGPSGAGCVRLACTVNRDKLSEALDRLERFLATWRA